MRTAHGISFARAAFLCAVLPACELTSRTVGFEPIEAIEPGIERELTIAGSCGDLFVFATDPGQSVALIVYVTGAPIYLADQSSEPVVRVYDVAGADTNVGLARGDRLVNDGCNLEPGVEPVSLEVWSAPQDAAQHGTLEVEIDPGEPGDLRGIVTLSLFDVTFHREDADDDDFVIEEMTFAPTEAGVP